jgi:hypothetical protein
MTDVITDVITDIITDVITDAALLHGDRGVFGASVILPPSFDQQQCSFS